MAGALKSGPSGRQGHCQVKPSRWKLHSNHSDGHKIASLKRHPLSLPLFTPQGPPYLLCRSEGLHPKTYSGVLPNIGTHTHTHAYIYMFLHAHACTHTLAHKYVSSPGVGGLICPQTYVCINRNFQRECEELQCSGGNYHVCALRLWCPFCLSSH